MNALLIEETEDNFSGESIPPAKVVEAGDPRPKTWTESRTKRPKLMQDELGTLDGS